MLYSGHIKSMIVFRGLFGSGRIGLSSEDSALVDTCGLAFFLLVTVLREPTLSFLSHVIQDGS